ncbi:MAG: DUF1540 domain-containing protein [Halanaerobiales bacterium]|nr:DUF1540 domain-containing protein [Halanaerobiales bacterium]
MPRKISCDVNNCTYNEENNCRREKIRVLANTPEATGNEAISCMSFRNRNLTEANARPELAEANKT